MNKWKVLDERDRVILDRLSRPQSGRSLARVLGISAPSTNERLRRLADLGLVQRVGAGRGSRWHRLWPAVHTFDLSSDLDEDAVWHGLAEDHPELAAAGDLCERILRYVVTETVNNAIDHSQGSHVEVRVDPGDPIRIAVLDDGIGALPNVRERFGLQDDLEAISWLDAGRQTTDPDRHSGQGLFFTSRAVSRFALTAGTAIWIVDNRVDDRTVRVTDGSIGTAVDLELDRDWARPLRAVFEEHSDPDDLEFDRTTVHIRLAEAGREFVSRSEAKRIATQLEDFSIAVIDFDGVESVGQGFVDELFRVLPNHRPDLELVPINANEAVSFMLRRGLSPPQ